MDDGEKPKQSEAEYNKQIVDNEQRNLGDLWTLRHELNNQCERDLAERKSTNPAPTDIEKKLGTYIEELEPQVRRPVLEFNRKGYMTTYAGFHGENCNQMIMGDFRIDDETRQQLIAIGISVAQEPNLWAKRDKYEGKVREGVPEDASFTTVLTFSPEVADLQAIGSKWEQVSDMLPDRGEPSVNWYPEYRFNEDIINWKD